ncbi:hypothetical protein L7F22_067350 [Adiantum nelumboides]|nr:hypothetical protein [Adiantum nelumboides]
MEDCIGSPDGGYGLASSFSKMLKEYARMKLMQVIAERDAAMVQRDHVLAEKKVAFEERASAFLQRNIAYAKRDAAMVERDHAMVALENARGHRALGWNQFKRQPELKGRDSMLLQMSLPSGPFMVEEPHSFNGDPAMLSFITNNPEKYSLCNNLNNLVLRQKRRMTQSQKGRERHLSTSLDGQKSEPKKKRVNLATDGEMGVGSQHNTLSMHPLPMNPLKKGYRLPGRKMSAGAFQKLVKRITQEGVDLSQPIDFKNYWAKHGTNRYITIKMLKNLGMVG